MEACRLSQTHGEVPVRVKQVFDVVQIGDGKFLNNIKNSLNGLHFGFDVREGPIKIAAALHGPANMVNYDDFVWNKYQIGEWLNVTDSSTGKPAVRQHLLCGRNGMDATSYTKDPDDPESVYQDASVQALEARGVQFLSCHTALEEQAHVLVRRKKLAQSPEDVVREMLAHTVPGVLVVASMGSAIALLQAEGHYTYITV